MSMGHNIFLPIWSVEKLSVYHSVYLINRIDPMLLSILNSKSFLTSVKKMTKIVCKTDEKNIYEWLIVFLWKIRMGHYLWKICMGYFFAIHNMNRAFFFIHRHLSVHFVPIFQYWGPAVSNNDFSFFF